MAAGRRTHQAGAMTTTPPDAPAGPPPGPHDGPRVSRDEIRDLARLRRSRTDRKIAGVAGGIARHLDIDPLLVRVALVVLVFFGGASLLVYAAVWLLVPEDGSDRARINLDDRTRGVVLIVVGVLAALALVGDSWGAIRFPWPLAVLGLLVLWLVTRDGSRHRPTATTPAYPAPAYPTPAYSTPAYPAPAVPGEPAAPADPAAPITPSAPAPPAVAWAPPPPDPRRRGPRLFGATLALVATALGALGMVDLAGADLPAAAYPALAVTVCGAVLVLGAFWGRAGGVILLGLVSALVLVVTAAGDHWGHRWGGDWGDRTVTAPTSAAALASSYSFDAGNETYDLRGITRIADLDGRVLAIDGTAGDVRVLVPEGLAVVVDARIDGPGSVDAFGRHADGWGVDQVVHHGDTADPELRVVVNLSIGHVEVAQR